MSLPIAYSVAIGAIRPDPTAFGRKPKKRCQRGGPATRLTDEQILELRALRQFAGWRQGQLMERYGIDEASFRRYAEGITRANLIAKPEHLPPEVRRA